MRREEPVFYYEPLDTFVLTRHEDIRSVNRTPELFSSAKGVFLNDIRYRAKDAKTITDSFFPAGGEQIEITDPPRHP